MDRLYADSIADFAEGARDLADPAERWHDSFITAIGIEHNSGTRALAELVYAAIDGIELHHALAEDDYPLDEVLAILEDLMIRAQRERATK